MGNQDKGPRVCRVTNTRIQDNSGTIERDEFLSLPQVSSNPLATRFAGPFFSDLGVKPRKAPPS